MSDFYLNPDFDNEPVIRNIGKTIRALDNSKKWHICIKPYKKTRSMEQQGFYWGAFLPAIANWHGESRGIKVDVKVLHEELKQLYVPYTVSAGTTGNEVTLHKSTSDLTTWEFNQMLDEMASDFSDMGCATPLPDPNWKVNVRKPKKDVAA